MKTFLAVIHDEEQKQTQHEEVQAPSWEKAYEHFFGRWPGMWIHEVREVNELMA